MVNILPSSVDSITLTNFITLVCRILSCDSEYQYPVSESDLEASRRNDAAEAYGTGFDTNSNDLAAPVRNGVDLRDPEALISSGRVRGYYMTILRGQRINAFEGIPYANAERFKDPVPVKPWDGVRDAKSSESCIQLHYGRLVGTVEDCLTVNVYSKNLDPLKPYPVIIFIHGGFWISGAGKNYGPAYLLDVYSDVILVTFNYRLGVLGYWTTGDKEASGNFGLKDQAFLINWVSENIASFGGDPKRITVAGSSAGAVSAHMHLYAHSDSRDKIHSAISMSGTAYNIWGLNRYNTSVIVSAAMANISGCPTTSGSKVMVECMRGVDAATLVANQLLTSGSGYFIPSIEANIPGAFLTRTPDEAYANGDVARVPWIVSTTSRELNLPVNALQSSLLLTLLRGIFLGDLSGLLTVRGNGIEDEEQVRKKIVEFYGNGKTDSVNDFGQEEFSRVATDRYFTAPIHKAIQMHSQIAPTYASVFNYASKLGRAGKLGFANHAEFGSLVRIDFKITKTVYCTEMICTRHHPPVRRFDPHFAITKLLVNLYANFARYGEPLYFDDKREYRIWDVVKNPDQIRFLWIDEETKMIEDPYRNVTAFWEGLGIPDITPAFKL